MYLKGSNLVEGRRPRDRRLLPRCSSLANFSAGLDVPKLVPHAHLDRLEVGVELELTIGLVHVWQRCEVGGEPALERRLEEDDILGAGSARQLLHELDHLLQVVHTFLTLLTKEGELDLLSAECLLQIFDALGPPLPKHRHIKVVRLTNFAKRLLILRGKSRGCEVEGLRSLLQLSQFLPSLLQQSFQPVRRVVLLLDLRLLAEAGNSVPLKGNHELVGNDAIGQSSLAQEKQFATAALSTDL